MLIIADLLGLHARDLEWYQMLLRTLVVFIAALAFIRLSGMRTFGMQSPFDMVVYITLGGMLSKTIMGHYPFFPCLVACGGLVALHRLIAFLSYKNKLIRKLTAGDAVLLFSGGTTNKVALDRYNISHQDLMVTIRENGLDSYNTIKTIWLEPDGTISIVKKD